MELISIYESQDDINVLFMYDDATHTDYSGDDHTDSHSDYTEVK